MSMARTEILEAVAQMSVMDVVQLIEDMEKKFNVKAAAPVAAAAATSAAAAEVEEKTEFDVVLKSFGANKVAVIKAVRTITNLPLKEAKDLVEAAPKAVKEAVSKAESDELKKVLEEAGAEVEIK